MKQKKMIKREAFFDVEEVIVGRKISQIIVELEEYQRHYGDAIVRMDFGYDGCDSHLEFEEEETDKEFEKRLVKEKMEKERQKRKNDLKKQKRYNEYLKLKSEFEKDGNV